MAKKKSPSEPHIVPLYPVISDKELSALEVQFNSKIEKVSKLKKSMEDMQAWIPDIRSFEDKRHAPLRKQAIDKDVEIMYAIDEAISEKKNGLSKSDVQLLKELLEENLGILVFEHKREELAPLFEKYAGTPFEEAKAQMQEEAAQMMKIMMKEATGVDMDFSDVEDFSDPAALMGRVMQEMEDKKSQIEDFYNEEKEKADARKKKKAKNGPAEPSEEELKALPKALREIYSHLVKHFHPDLEQDETEKVRKTAITQEITKAYEKGDIYHLLRMKWELSDKTGQLPEKTLANYIKLLDEQEATLQREIGALRRPMPPFDHYYEYFRCKTFKGVEKKMKEREDMFVHNLSNKSFILQQAKTTAGLKTIAKEYAQSKQELSMEDMIEMLMRGKM